MAKCEICGGEIESRDALFVSVLNPLLEPKEKLSPIDRIRRVPFLMKVRAYHRSCYRKPYDEAVGQVVDDPSTRIVMSAVGARGVGGIPDPRRAMLGALGCSLVFGLLLFAGALIIANNASKGTASLTEIAAVVPAFLLGFLFVLMASSLSIAMLLNWFYSVRSLFRI